MRNLLLTLIFGLLAFTGFSQIQLVGNITTFGGGSYPTHIDSLGYGGLTVVADATERDAITQLRRKVGMIVFQVDESQLYYLDAPITENNWIPIESGTTNPDTTATTIYCPAHGLDLTDYEGEFLPMFACRGAQADHVDSLQTYYAVSIPDPDSITIIASGLIYRPNHDLADFIGKIVYLTNTVGVYDTIQGTVLSAIAVVIDSNYIDLLPRSVLESDRALSVLILPASFLNAYMGDAKVPQDTAVQRLARLYASVGLLRAGGKVITQTTAISDNPIYGSVGSNPVNPGMSWTWTGGTNGRVIKDKDLVVSIDLEDTAYGGLDITPLDTVLLVDGVPTDTTVFNWLEDNLTSRNLRLPNGSLLYFIGNGTRQNPDYIWMVMDDISGNVSGSTRWSRLIKRIKEPGGSVTSTTEIIPIPPNFPFQPPFDIERVTADSFKISDNFSLVSYANITATDTFYVDVSVVSSGTGQSWGQAYKGLDEAITAANGTGTAKLIYVAKGWYPKQHSWNAVVPTVELRVEGVLTQGTGTDIFLTTDLRDSIGSFTPTTNYYSASLNIQPEGVYDSSLSDAFGDSQTLTKRSSIALVNSNPGSWHWASNILYIRTSDSRAPDASLRYYDNATNMVISADSKSYYLKNLEFRGRGVSAGSASSVGGLGVYLEDCGGKEIVNGALNADGCEIFIFGGTWAKTDSVDILNYHSQNSIPPTVVEYNVTAYNSAELHTGCGNCQTSTLHDDGRSIRINGNYSYASGQNIADVSGADSWLLGVTSSYSRTEIGYFFGSSGTPAKYYLLDCTSIGNNTDIQSESDAEISYRNFTPDPPTVLGAGTFAAHYAYNSDSGISGDLDMGGNDIQNVGDLEATNFETRDTSLIFAWDYRGYDANLFVGKSTKGVSLSATSYGNGFFGNGAGRLAQGLMINNLFIGTRSGEGANGADYNTFVGASTAGAALTGEYNTALGYFSGHTITSGSYSTIIGALAGTGIVAGTSNTLVGSSAQSYFNVSTVTAVGTAAAQSNTASSIVAVGAESLKVNTGVQNTGVGTFTMFANRGGTNNTAGGYESMKNNTTGSQNSYWGTQSGQNGLTVSNNTYAGYRAGRLNTAGGNNAVFGKEAFLQGQGSFNTTVGSESFFNLTSGDANIGLGYGAGNVALSTTNFIAIGVSAGATGQKNNGINMLVVGRSGFVTQDGYMGFGSATYPYTNMFLGEGELSTSPGDFVISGSNASGLNIAGGGLYITPGRSTGSGAGGDIFFQTTPAGAGGASLNSLVTDVSIKKGGILNAVTGFQIGGAAASGKILKGNGANYVASTETYAAPGSSGNVMTSDGVNWTSAAPAAAVVNLSLTGTSQIIELTNSAGADIVLKGVDIGLTKVTGTKDTLYLTKIEHWGEVSISGGSTSVTAATPERPDNDTPGTPTASLSSEFTQSGSTVTYIGVAGQAEVTGAISFTTDAIGDYLVSLYQEGVELPVTEVRVSCLIGSYVTIPVLSTSVNVATNDTFDLRVEPVTGSANITVHRYNVYARKIY